MNKAKKTAPLKILLTEYLHRLGLRCTPERVAIAEIAYAKSGLWSCEELAADISATDFHVSRATVYNTLSVLVDLGVVMCHNVGVSSGALYETIGESGGSRLQVCISCGKIRRRPFPDHWHTEIEKGDRTFSVMNYSLTAYGLCSRCKKARNAQIKQKNQSTK